MNELILKYNSLDAFGKHELMDFLEFLVQKKINNTDNGQKNSRQEKILQVSTWTDNDTSKMNMMRMAANDPLYLQDLQEVQSDFETKLLKL